MGEVYRAHDARLDREVAIKILPAGGQGSVQRERFVREARAASALVHPNIITIHEINAADGVDFIVMEYVRGESLATLLARGPLPLARALEYSVQIVDALKAAHQAGVIHRDLKPANIMISTSGLVKVLDFGIAKRMGGGAGDGERTTAAALTIAGSSIGTPAYMSPEQTLGDEVDARSDLFSFGVVFYEMLAGQLPFQSTTNLSLVRQIVHEEPRPLRSAAPDVPDEIVAIVERCLAKEPAGRHASAEILHDELRSVAARIGSLTVSRVDQVTREAPAPAPAVETQRRPRASRGRTIVAGLMLAAVVAWTTGPSLVRWVRAQFAPAGLADEDAPPHELYARATERLRLYYREGNVDLAIKQLDRALVLKSPYPIVEARLSQAYWRKNRVSPDPEWQKRALAHAERAVADNDQLAISHIALGAALMLTGALDKAAAAYQKAETLDPSNWELQWQVGDLAVALKDLVVAEQRYRRATEVAPQEWEPHSRLGVFLYGQGRYPDAIASFEKMQAVAPDHPRAYSSLAAAYHQLGRPEEAAAFLQRALQIAPDAQTYSNLGTNLYFQGKYPEAVHAFDEAVKLNATSYQRWGNLGDAVRMATPGSKTIHESYVRALQLARDQLTKTPSDATNIRSNIALYLARDGQIPEALAELDQVLAQKSLPGAVLFKAVVVAELANQRAKALGLLRQALAARYPLREISTEPDLVKLRADPEYHKLASQYEK